MSGVRKLLMEVAGKNRFFSFRPENNCALSGGQIQPPAKFTTNGHHFNIGVQLKINHEYMWYRLIRLHNVLVQRRRRRVLPSLALADLVRFKFVGR